jgi:hypothetical protein
MPFKKSVLGIALPDLKYEKTAYGKAKTAYTKNTS